MMTIKRMLFRLAVRSMEQFTLLQKPKRICHLDTKPISDEKHVDIITVAFNNIDLIKIQERDLKRFVRDKYCHIIVDNSSKPEVRDELYTYCKQEGIAYVSLPKNLLGVVSASYSHATAVNYVYKHFISKRRPYAFGLMDHDLFLTRPTKLTDKLVDQPIYGPLRLRDECWYLSAIMCFFRFDYIRDKRVDFMPVTPYKTYMDTGGGNWYDIYSRLDRSQIIFPNELIEPLRDGGDRHGDSLEWFDDKLWLHTINGSCWKPIAAGKDNLVRERVEQILAD